jgi:hypothetical protein
MTLVLLAVRTAAGEPAPVDDVLRQAEERDRAERTSAEQEARRLEESRRVEREHAAVEEARRAAEAEARAERRREAEVQAASVRTKRNWGTALMVVGAAAGAGAAWYAYQGAKTNDQIRRGGFATASAIVDANTQGKSYNTLALGLGVGGAAALAVGTPLYLLNLRDPPMVSVLPSAGGAFLALSGTFP